VLTEATHLLAGVRGGRAACVDFFLSGGALLVPSSTASLQRVRKLLDKYADLPMDFADATLVALAEELDCTSVFTTDRTDYALIVRFSRYGDGTLAARRTQASAAGRKDRHGTGSPVFL
jgi:predicted nucleic acid-binding protein